ncbi:hypothetical protein [Acinetobacter bereziniae]|nr:hypothetical protein [Acinetobacter bereziniae]
MEAGSQPKLAVLNVLRVMSVAYIILFIVLLYLHGYMKYKYIIQLFKAI